jgi:hypothetical protein
VKGLLAAVEGSTVSEAMCVTVRLTTLRSTMEVLSSLEKEEKKSEEEEEEEEGLKKARLEEKVEEEGEGEVQSLLVVGGGVGDKEAKRMEAPVEVPHPTPCRVDMTCCRSLRIMPLLAQV